MIIFGPVITDKDGDEAQSLIPLEKFLEFVEENFSPMGNDMWLCNHSADEEFSGKMVIEQFEREVTGIDKFGNKIEQKWQ